MLEIGGYKFKDSQLLKLAMLHPSLKKSGSIESYERLEFLGDRVLGFVIADIIYQKFPTKLEGQLALMHSQLVKRETLARIASTLKLEQRIAMHKSEERNKGRVNQGNLEDALEALIAAIYIDGGVEEVRAFITKHWGALINEGLVEIERDAKSALQEWAQKNGLPIPVYTMKSRRGSDHQPVFCIEVTVNGWEPITAEGASKKEAQVKAATALLSIIKKGKT